MAAKLTAKQEAFAVAVAKGMTASDAYRKAYGQKAATDKSVNEVASRLLKNVKVASRVAELQAPVLRRHQASVERSLEEAISVAYGRPDEPLTYAAKMKALDLLFRHLGMFEKDNAQRRENLALQINLVGNPEPAATPAPAIVATFADPKGS